MSRVFGLSLFLCGWLSAQSSCTEKTDPDSKLNIHKNRNRGNFDLLPTCLRPFSLSLSLSEKGSLELDASYPVGAMKGGLFANDRISGPLPRPTPAMWPFLPLAPYGANRRGAGINSLDVLSEIGLTICQASASCVALFPVSRCLRAL